MNANGSSYRAVIEELVLDGIGRVDVSLTRDALNVACEISVTTGRDHEIENLEKCLAAEYLRVTLVSTDAWYLSPMEKLADRQFDDGERGKLHFKIRKLP
jgi:hypothetical protein